MSDWSRASERYLVNLLCQTETTSIDAAHAHAELTRRLERYFEKKTPADAMQSLRPYRQEIIDLTIGRLMKTHEIFRGNSWQFRKFLRKAFWSVCVDYLRKEQPIDEWLDAEIYAQGEGTSDGATGSEMLMGADVPVQSRYRVSQDWSEGFDNFRQASPEVLLIDKENKQLLVKVLVSLDKECQELIYREYVQEQPQKEIAAELGISHSLVRRRLNKCREALRRQFFAALTETVVEKSRVDMFSMFAQLPEKQQIIIKAWWHGKTQWRLLGQLFSPPLPQAEVKNLFADGLALLFVLLSAVNTNVKDKQL